jgi:hypothetical protein
VAELGLVADGDVLHGAAAEGGDIGAKAEART